MERLFTRADRSACSPVVGRRLSCHMLSKLKPPVGSPTGDVLEGLNVLTRDGEEMGAKDDLTEHLDAIVSDVIVADQCYFLWSRSA